MTTTQHGSGRHEAGHTGRNAAGPSWGADLRDALSPRTVLLVLGVLGLQLGFILSYVGAFHQPTPTRIPVAVVTSQQFSARTVAALNDLPGHPLNATAVADDATARQLILTRKAAAAFLLGPGGTTDTLLVASGAGPALADAVEQTVTAVETARQRTVKVVDIVPLQSGDGRGLTSFYLVIGWILGGYLASAIIGVSRGSRPATGRRAVIRLAAMVPYALASGLGGAVIIGPVLNALTGHFLALWAIGSLLVFAAAAVTMAFQALMGVVGIGLAVLFFVVLGNPSAGGPYPPALLPAFWRVIGGALPNGAGTAAVRNTIYFSGQATTAPLLILGGYALAGTLLTLAASAWWPSRTPLPQLVGSE